MAKIRVHELAKELAKESKDIIEFLGKELKSASGLEDEDVSRVRAHFAKKEEVPEKKEPVPEKKEAVPEKKADMNEEKEAKEINKAPEEPKKAPEEPKKKKPIFVFRPENSGYNAKSGQQKGGQNKGNGERRPRPEGDPNRKNSQGQSQGARPQGNGERRVIKPSVPTTAQNYREFAKDERPVTQTPVQPQTEEVKTAPVNPAPAAEQVNTPVVPENMTEIKKNVPAQENVHVQDIKEDVKPAAPQENTAFEQSVQPAAPEEAAKPVRKNVFREMEEKRRQMEEQRRIDAENRKNQPQTQRTGERRDQRQGQGGQGGQNRNRQGQGGQGQNRPFNREGSQSGQARSGRPNFHFSENGQRQGQGGQGGNRPGGFNQRPAGGGRNEGASSGFAGKSDVRGKKDNKSDKDRRNNNDKNGRNQENFKTLNRKNELHKKPEVRKEEEQIKMIVIPDVITLKDLADKMKMKASDLIKKLFLKGKMVTVNTELSYEEAEEIALDYDILCEMEQQVDVIEELLKEDEEDESLMVKRPPVVCVMGHVDHGKTSLLDAIRKTNVTSREAGGITQHIGAYMVESKGEKITFLDTPGHEAFTAMRMRGAQATDIAILVVAADDGVMPQTVEAINHAKAAGVDVIVAVNKIDKPAANVDRVKQELTEYELVAEDWGGDTVFVPVSARTGEGIDTLLEMILLVTEVKELKANPNREMRGIVIEAKLDKGRGPVATVLIQKGTLKVGDFVSAGSTYGRVRAMLDADGNSLKSAGPSTPVEILGLNGVPNAGEVCIGHKNEKDARSYADTFVAEEKKQKLAETKQKLTMDSLFEQIQAGAIKELPIVVKADVQGSVEAVRNSLEKLSNEEVAVKVIHSGVGAINESDITLASASNAIVIGFNVKPDAQAKTLAETENVDVKLYRVIYQAIEDVERALKGMQAPVYEEHILGHAEVRQTFKASGVGVIAGCYVLDGTIERNCQVRITRGKEQIYEGPLVSLKRFKDDVKEAREGYECGMVFEKFNDLMEGDVVEAYKMVEVERD